MVQLSNMTSCHMADESDTNQMDLNTLESNVFMQGDLLSERRLESFKWAVHMFAMTEVSGTSKTEILVGSA